MHSSQDIQPESRRESQEKMKKNLATELSKGEIKSLIAKSAKEMQEKLPLGFKVGKSNPHLIVEKHGEKVKISYQAIQQYGIDRIKDELLRSPFYFNPF